MNSSLISKYKPAIILTLALTVFLASCKGTSTTPEWVAPGWEVSTLAGSGVAGHHDATGTAARFNRPAGVAVDSSGILYVADQGNHAYGKSHRQG